MKIIYYYKYIVSYLFIFLMIENKKRIGQEEFFEQ